MATEKPKILIQLDTDSQPSVFDAVVAIDAGVDQLLRHVGVEPASVRDLVHGALFTRGIADLHRTALFIGGSDVAAGEAVLKAVQETFFGPFRVSILLDSNGCNTTAAAAVLAAVEGMGGSVARVRAAVLGGTGPVGQRVARLLAGLGAHVTLGSRRLDRARAAALAINTLSQSPITPFASSDPDALLKGLESAAIIVAAGAAGAVLLPKAVLDKLTNARVLIDLNAVPPLGIEGVESTDKGADRDGRKAWGAVGVGAAKMKIHKKAVQALFESNEKVIDAEQCLALGGLNPTKTA
jgi:methylenetetrahydrofolate/methylenetetrahydromethanopterin dehydrogenase (NADP+)